MNLRFHPSLWLAFLLVSCDKPQHGGDSGDSDHSSPNATRSSRSRPENATSGSKQLRASLDEAMAIESLEARDKEVAEIVKKALEIDGPLSAEAFRNLSSECAEKPQLLEECARRLLARSQAESLAWANLLGSTTDVVAAKGTIAMVLAESEPLHAVEILLDSGVSFDDAEGAAVQVIQTWGASAPQDAATWAVSAPSVESRKGAIKTVTSQWMMSDPKAALDWAAALGNPSVRQEVSHAVAESLVGIPELIRDSILQNADPKLRDELEQQVDQLNLDAPPPTIDVDDP